MSKEQTEVTVSLQEIINQIISRQKEFARYSSRKRDLIPKTAIVIDHDEQLCPYLTRGAKFTLSGEGFLPIEHILGRRTVFLETPILKGNQTYYLEVKGYGRNGRELYPNKHEEGDLFFGLFIDGAEREYYYPNILRAKGIDTIQLPCALLKLETSEFIEHALRGLREIISARLYHFAPDHDRVWKAVEKLFPNKVYDGSAKENLERIGKDVAREFSTVFRTAGIEGLKKITRQLHLEDELAGLIDGREAGYIIRAVKSPLRVGDLHDKGIVTKKNKSIAIQIGQTVRKMLEMGYWHLTPNPGNWTTAGELVDFEDVIEYPRQFFLAEEDMKFRGITTTEDYIKFVFGEGTIGYLTSDFQLGFMGQRTSTKQLIAETLRILTRLTRS